MKIQVTIEGVTPLLMNRFTYEAEIAVSSGLVRNDQGTPRELAARTAYCVALHGEAWSGEARQGKGATATGLIGSCEPGSSAA
jgi:hypothetical protein